MSANPGGTVIFLYGRTDAGVQVTLSGSQSFKQDDTGSAITYPQTITTKTSYTTHTDGVCTVTVAYGGRTVKTYDIFLAGGASHVINCEPNREQLQDVGPVIQVTTTAALAAIANAINTTGKFPGKTVFNSTTNKLNTAVDGTAGGLWKLGDGTTGHTPA